MPRAPKPDPPPEPEDVSKPIDQEHAYRYIAARTAGLNHEEAEIFAHHGSLHLLHRCMAKGCPPDLLRRILL